MTEPIAFEDRFAEQLRAYAGPASRPPRPEDVANAAVFLASDEASFVNGTHLFVDNGFTAA